MANDYIGMTTILNQIKAHFGLSTNAQALQYIQENCNRWFPNFHWELPLNPEAQIDCYDCRAQIMQRYMASQGCPTGWIASPVNASTLTSKNPCEQRNTTSNFGTSQFQPVHFYNNSGDPVLRRAGSMKSALIKKRGSTMSNTKARRYNRIKGKNPNVINNTNSAGVIDYNAPLGSNRSGLSTMGRRGNPRRCYRIDAGGCIECPSSECNKKTTPCKYRNKYCKEPRPAGAQSSKGRNGGIKPSPMPFDPTPQAKKLQCNRIFRCNCWYMDPDGNQSYKSCKTKQERSFWKCEDFRAVNYGAWEPCRYDTLTI